MSKCNQSYQNFLRFSEQFSCAVPRAFLMFSTQKKELLLCGYVREQYDIEQIPNEIILSMMKWLSNRHYINISGDLMKEFLSKE